MFGWLMIPPDSPHMFSQKNPGDPICWPRLRPRRLRPNAASTALPALRPHQAGCHGFEAPWTKWSRPAIWGHRNMDFSETLGKKTKSTGENQDDHLPSFLHSHLGLPCSDTATFEIISNPETCKCQSRSRNRCLEMQGIFHGIWTSHRTVTKNSLLKSVETYWSWSLWASFSRKNPSLGLAHAAGGCSARMQTRTRSQLASAKYCNVTAQNDCGANLLQKLRCNSALLYILRKFWECTCICWQLLRSWLQKPLAFAYYKNEKNTSVPTWWVLRLLTTTSPWQVLKSPFIYCFQATGKALRPTAPRWKSLSEATPEPAHIVRCTGKIILLYIYILVRLLLPRLSHLPAQIMIQQNSMG